MESLQHAPQAITRTRRQSTISAKMPRPRTVAKSFRINEEALEALQEEATRQNISVNTLVNQLLLDYAEFGRFVQRANAVRLTRRTFEEILNIAPEEGLSKAGHAAGKSAPGAIITSKWGKLNMDNVIGFVRDLSTYANLFEYYEKEENGHWTITLVHEMGPKWSAFIAHYISEAFVAAGTQPKMKTSDRAVIFTL